jgi:hypothetical protein
MCVASLVSVAPGLRNRQPDSFFRRLTTRDTLKTHQRGHQAGRLGRNDQEIYLQGVSLAKQYNRSAERLTEEEVRRYLLASGDPQATVVELRKTLGDLRSRRAELQAAVYRRTQRVG